MISHLSSEYPQHQFRSAGSKEEYENSLSDCQVLITGHPSDSDLEMAKKLSLIIVPFAGISQLNFSLLGQRGIIAANSHGNAPVVAERAVALAMSCCGRIVEFHNDMKKGQWHRTGNVHKPFEYWFSLTGKKVTILGTGAIGRNIASLLKGFRCDIKGFRKGTGESLEDFNSITTDLEEALRFGDIIFLALPLTEHTKGIISYKNMSLLEHKFIINVGRGHLIEEEPFYNALKDRFIGGAGIDAWYEYPNEERPHSTGSRFPFHELPNVVVSPHAASHAVEGKAGQLTGVLDVLKNYLDKNTVINRIEGEY